MGRICCLVKRQEWAPRGVGRYHQADLSIIGASASTSSPGFSAQRPPHTLQQEQEEDMAVSEVPPSK